MMTLLSIDSCGICQHLKALRKKKQKNKITSLLDTVNLTDSAHKKLGGFSGWYETKSIDCSSVT